MLICFVKKSSSDKKLGDHVRVAVRCRSPVFQVALLLLSYGSWYADAAASVGHTCAEVVNARGLMVSGQSSLVVLSTMGVICFDVLGVSLGQLLDSLLDMLDATLFTHQLGRVVGVSAGSIPVARDRLGVERDDNTELLGDTVQDVAGHPKMVTTLDSFEWTDLELPLRRHYFGVDTTDLYSGVQTCLVVGVDDVAAV